MWFIQNSTDEDPVSTIQIVDSGSDDVVLRLNGDLNRGASSPGNRGVLGLLAPTDGSTGYLTLSVRDITDGTADRPNPPISVEQNTFVDLRRNQTLPEALNRTGGIFGEGGLSKSEGGIGEIGQINTYTGGTFIHTGGLRLVGDMIPLEHSTSDNSYSEEEEFYAGTLGPGLLVVREGASFDLNGLTQALAGLRNDVYLDAEDNPVESGGSILLGTGGELTLDTEVDSDFDGVISGSGVVVKTGEGTQTFTSAQTFTGLMEILEGTVRLAEEGALAAGDIALVDGFLDLADLSAASYTLGASQTLSGAGTILAGDKTLIIEGALSPGNSPGELVVSGGTLDISLASDLIFELGLVSDSVQLIDGASLEIGVLDFDDFTFVPLAGFDEGVYTLIHGWDSLGGSLGEASGMIGGFESHLFFDGNNLNLQVIPEPSSMLFVLAGLGALLGWGGRRRFSK